MIGLTVLPKKDAVSVLCSPWCPQWWGLNWMPGDISACMLVLFRRANILPFIFSVAYIDGADEQILLSREKSKAKSPCL